MSLLVCAVLLAPRLAPAQSPLLPGHVHALAERLAGDVELLRIDLGVARDLRPPPRVTGVSPFEVYLQAHTLLEKVDRLSFEQIRVTTPIEALPQGDLQPADVHRLVAEARARLEPVLRARGLEPSSHAVMFVPEHTPTDVFQRVVLLHRQVGALLREQLTPSDVYTVLSQALAYATYLRLELPGARPPKEAPFEDGKAPADVHAELYRCFRQLRGIAGLAGMSMLELDPHTDWTIVPDDVFELGALVLAELRQLHARTGRSMLIQVPYPGPKTPSNVFQRAQVLRSVLEDLAVALEQSPGALQPADDHP